MTDKHVPAQAASRNQVHASISRRRPIDTETEIENAFHLGIDNCAQAKGRCLLGWKKIGFFEFSVFRSLQAHGNCD